MMMIMIMIMIDDDDNEDGNAALVTHLCSPLPLRSTFF